MNKYQREKRKRRKQLEALGVGYYGQKKVLRACKGDLDKVDQVIEGVKGLRNNTPSLIKVLKRLVSAIWEGVKNYGK